MVDHIHSWQALERAPIGTHDRAPCSGRRDDGVVGAARPASSAHGDEQARVVEGHGLVVRQERNGRSDVIDIQLSACPLAFRCQLGADGELGEGDGGDRDVVVVAAQLVEFGGTSFGVDEEGPRGKPSYRSSARSLLECGLARPCAWRDSSWWRAGTASVCPPA